MAKLVISDFSRMAKSLCFRIYMGFAAIYGVITVLSEYISLCNAQNMGFDVNFAIDRLAFNGLLAIMFAAAVFAGMFVGREYSDGTIRNKLVVGHGRFGIYLSNFTVCAAVNVLALLINLIAVFSIGIPLMGIDMSAGEAAVNIVISVIAIVSITALFIFIAMLVKSKASALVILLLFTFFMFGATSFVDSLLEEPEYYGGMELVATEDNGFEYRMAEQEKNPYYLEGDARKAFEFLNDFLPSSQLYRIASLNAPELAKTAIYDIIVLIAVTEAGILLFRKKDIK